MQTEMLFNPIQPTQGIKEEHSSNSCIPKKPSPKTMPMDSHRTTSNISLIH